MEKKLARLPRASLEVARRVLGDAFAYRRCQPLVLDLEGARLAIDGPCLRVPRPVCL